MKVNHTTICPNPVLIAKPLLRTRTFLFQMLIFGTDLEPVESAPRPLVTKSLGKPAGQWLNGCNVGALIIGIEFGAHDATTIINYEGLLITAIY